MKLTAVCHQDKGNAPVRKRISAEELKEAEVDVDGGEDLPPHLQHLEEKAPRERSSKTKADCDAMLAAHVNIDNRLPPLGGSLQKILRTQSNRLPDERIKTCGRLQSLLFALGATTERAHLDEATFHRNFVNYRCRHGVHQKRRGKGKRNTDVNYTGCRARFDVAIQNVASAGSQPRHRLVVLNEWRLLNHPTEIAGKAAKVKDVPVEGIVAQTVAALHDSNTSSGKIDGFMSEELGK
ncbi:Sedoheptulokinase [Phytophthora megakarya]|uniref:Sedoheptulokinase n=1 Tax=Phytophthora megakarya TaxID=4795 RepID=A0A225UUT2_9STRA|nr:Sedoheptulokinase [Phytophthora megakarya]